MAKTEQSTTRAVVLVHEKPDGERASLGAFAGSDDELKTYAAAYVVAHGGKVIRE